jgi:UDP-N-acetylmuramate--alanine ligase
LRVITYGEHPTAQVRLDPADASPPRTAGAGPGRASTTDPARPGARPPAVPGHAAAQVTVAGHAPLRLQLAVPGRHNLLDAAAALAVGTALGAPVEGLVAGLARFPGTHRRLEPRGQARGVVLLDSYAHHPTEVVADLRAARELVPAGGRLVVAFQPHLYSRTRTFARELGAALGLADVVVVTDVYPAREDPLPGVTGRLVADAVPLPHDRVRYVPAVADLPGRLAALARPGDLVLTLGAGDITTAAAPLLTALGGQAGAG